MGPIMRLCLPLALLVGLASSRMNFAVRSVMEKMTDESSNTCTPTCTNLGIGDGDVVFAENQKYSYEFSGKTTIIAPTGTEDGISEVSIKGMVNVIGMSSCGALLYLKNIDIMQGSKVYSDTNLQGYPILFSYNNGKVNPSFGSFMTDSVASSNLKRAILSALQVSSVQEGEFLETDVQGTCNTVYSSSLSNTISVTKDKDLTRCTGHEKINSLGMSSSQSNPIYQNSPFSSAVHHSDIEIKDSTIISVSSQDNFLYQPFSDIDVVTKIKVSMNLVLKRKSPVVLREFYPNKCQSIGFQLAPTVVGPANAEALVAATQLAMTNLEPTIDMDGAKYFADLMVLLKVAKKNDMISAFQMIKSNTGFENTKLAEKVYVDALIATNYGESIEAVAELINNKVLSDSLAYSWLSNLANAKHPTKEAVVAVSSLLNGNALKESYMGVGTLLRKYLDDTQDYDSPEVRNTLNNLGAPLQKACDTFISSDDQNLAIASLKGLGNAQYINSDQEDSIVNIIMDKAAIQRIRAAALNMVKNFAQNSKVEKACESILLDASEDSELRILAFKVFVINPSNYKAAVIKNILDDKNCQLQIRAFLLSYLNNLQTTVDENKLNQKTFYEGIKTTPKKMLSDILRYSQNMEFSHKYPLIRSGVLLDTDVIYSYDSFLARSSSVSLKASIFGRKYHVFDLDVRGENFEPMLEKLFGPEGYFTKNNGHVVDDVKNYVTQAVNYAKNRELDNNQIDSSSNEYDSSSQGDMKKTYLDIALKVFENDLGWFAFQGLESKVTYQNLIDAILDNFNNLIPNKKNMELNIRKQLNIIDYEKKYATCSGLPVSLKIQATSAIKLNTATKFDLNHYLENQKKTYFSFKLIPSGSLALNTLLTIDGSAVEVGHKIMSSIHTSTGFDSSILAVEGRGAEIIYKLPLDTMDVLSMKSEAFATVQEKGRPLSEVSLRANTGGSERKTYENTFDDLSKSLGLSLYVNYDFPWNGELKSLLPFSGPSSFSLKVLKVDENLTKYVVKVTYNFHSSMIKYMKFVFGTPGVDFDRSVQLYVGHDIRHHSKIVTMLKIASTEIFQSELINSDKQKTLEINYVDGTKYIFYIGAKCEKLEEETMKYTPVFNVAYSTELSTKDVKLHSFVPVAELQGYALVQYDGDSKSAYPSKLTLKDLAVITSDRKHSLQGSVSLENNELKGDGHLTTGRINIKMDGYIGGDFPTYKMGGTMNLTRDESTGRQLLTDENDDYVSNSRFMNLLYNVKTLNLFTAQQLRIESPYVLVTDNQIHWDDDHFKINGDIHFEGNEFTMYGNMSTSNLLDLALNGNITVLPSTQNSGINVFGIVEHSFVSDPSNTGHTHIKFIQDKNNKGNYFEFNSESPQILGVFHVDSDYQKTSGSLKYVLNYRIHDNVVLNADIIAVTDDIQLNINYESPYSDKKSSVILRGWSEKENAYEFNSEISWPGSQDSNYLIANGQMIIDGTSSHLSGNIDCPSANLAKVHVSLQSEPNPGEKNGGLASLLYVTDAKTILSEKFKYKLIQNDDELYFSGESIHEDSQNFIPICLQAKKKNYQAENGNTGKEYAYKISLENSGQKLIYQRSLKVLNNMLIYRQLNKINDEEQLNLLDLQHDIKDLWNWSYYLKAKIVSPNIFKFLTYNDHNLLEFDSQAKVNNYALDERHVLKIYSSEDLVDLYEFKWRINNEISAMKFIYGNREIRKFAKYSLTPIEGGHHLKYSGTLWLDYGENPKDNSSLSIDSYYSLNGGLSTFSDINILVPSFDKEMGVKSDIKILKSWENPLDVKLDLNIFPTPEQTLQLHSSMNRIVQDDGVLYSAQLLAESDGMELDYSFRESIFVSDEKWGKYFDGYFIDSDGVKRPVQLHCELVSGGFTNKLNVFDIMVISVNSSIDVKDALNMQSTITHNGSPYSFGVLLTTYPSFKYEMAWNDKNGVNQKLVVDGSVTMDDSIVVSGKHIAGNKEPVSLGVVGKSLSQETWWNTNNQIVTNEWNPIWQSLKTQLIERFINVHSNLKNIISVAKSQRKLRMREARKAQSQYYPLVEYTRNEWNQISNEVYLDDYMLDSPFMGINFTKILLVEAVDFVGYIKLTDSLKNLRQHIIEDLKNIYNYYSTNFDSFSEYIKSGYDELLDQAKLTLLDILKMLDQYTNKFTNDMSSEPRSLNDYSNDIMNKLMYIIQELKYIINKIQDKPVNYVKNLSIYDRFQNQIETLKSYPYKEKLCEEIHKHLSKMEVTAPTKELADFINALDNYLSNVIHDIPVSKEDMIDLKNKGLAVAKSVVVNFSDYVDYSRAMSVYNALCKLTNFGKRILYLVSPNSLQYPNDERDGHNNMQAIDYNEYMKLYQQYLSPLDLLPPYKAQGALIDSTNVITYNGRPYSFMPGTGSYVLATDSVNDKFSVLANYKDNVLTSISVLTRSETYELLPGENINLNGENVDFPLTRDNVNIWKESDYFRVDLAVGISVKCTRNLDIVEAFVNGYYYGQVYGLLGAMYQEPTFDFKLPNGELSDDMLSFVTAYRTGGDAEPTVVDLVRNDQSPCPRLFSGVSTLKSVFPTVSPAAYRAICNHLVSSATSKQDRLDKACLVVKAYVTMAKENNAPTYNVPSTCLTSTAVTDTESGEF